MKQNYKQKFYNQYQELESRLGILAQHSKKD